MVPLTLEEKGLPGKGEEEKGEQSVLIHCHGFELFQKWDVVVV